MFTVGMATYDDFYGVNMTIQALRLHHAEHVKEILVIDNNPQSEQGQLTAKFCHGLSSQNVEYIPLYGVRGTAQPRNEVFRKATSKYVICCDPHVMFAPNSIYELALFYDRNPESKDLIQGPILWDDLKSGSTHFRLDEDAWGGEMWGKWDMAYFHKDRSKKVLQDHNRSELPKYGIMEPTFRVRKINGENCIVDTMTSEIIEKGINVSDMRNLGYFSAIGNSLISPFEIPAMGLGVFACHKDHWLEFNHKFFGFGGEEGYIHLKYKKAGRRTLCLPYFRWWHRFQRLGGSPYPNVVEEKARNYVIGFRELEMPLDPIYNHFVKGIGNEGGRPSLTEERWKMVLEEKVLPLNPFQEAKSPKGKCKFCNKEGKKEIEVNKGCSSCSQSSWNSDQWYEWASKTPSDINEHASVLKEYASKSDRVIEFGVRTGVSTAALLSGNPKQLISYDLNESAQARLMAAQSAKEGKDFQFFIGDSLTIEPEECDLLFIDTVHTAEQCFKELTRHGPHVKKWIILHDTEIYGSRGEDGKEGGLLHAVRMFLNNHKEWSTVKHFRNNHGLTVLSRVPEEQPPKLPSTWKMAKNLASSTIQDLANGRIRVPLEVAQQRHAICTSNGGSCPLGLRRIDDDRCSGCGCYLWEQKGQPEGAKTGKVWRPLDSCPHFLWGTYVPEEMREEESK